MVSINHDEEAHGCQDVIDTEALVIDHICSHTGFAPVTDDVNGTNAALAVFYHVAGNTLAGEARGGVVIFPLPTLIEFLSQAVKDVALCYVGVINSIQSGTPPMFVPLVPPMDDDEFKEGLERILNDGDTDVGKEPT